MNDLQFGTPTYIKEIENVMLMPTETDTEIFGDDNGN